MTRMTEEEANRSRLARLAAHTAAIVRHPTLEERAKSAKAFGEPTAAAIYTVGVELLKVLERIACAIDRVTDAACN